MSNINVSLCSDCGHASVCLSRVAGATVFLSLSTTYSVGALLIDQGNITLDMEKSGCSFSRFHFHGQDGTYIERHFSVL